MYIVGVCHYTPYYHYTSNLSPSHHINAQSTHTHTLQKLNQNLKYLPIFQKTSIIHVIDPYPSSLPPPPPPQSKKNKR
ncbi:hypothetical protein EJ05DRAFT_56534 [Pseudovirgaria hyperparasitica]|uniref:Uncharacterized protein n=1 Tax=Pseudovirgaria hyperparasitica TaxID=470096 RepID=A0A6A6W2H1_9PEZI|nr:uncharacterized protein EJ05DRAFT_56534 [Pseudovirgaria hyperparasitica]KAF2757128.1 hypothetical protein EJ05DRAFT_56534 [Pseudovirgaria hyperparasitica]